MFDSSPYLPCGVRYPRYQGNELGRPVTMVSEVGCWFSNPCVYFQKHLLLQPRQKYLFMKFISVRFIDFHIFWNSLECSFIVGIHLCVIISKAAFRRLCFHLCLYSPLMQHWLSQRHLEPFIRVGDTQSGHEQSIAWRPTIQQRSLPFGKDQITNPSSLRYIYNIS